MTSGLAPATDRRPILFLGAHVSALFIDVDRVPGEGETVLGTAIREPVDGGKSTCQAVAAARLGAPVAFASVLGTDERGDWWLEHLAAEGIDTRWLRRHEGRTDMGVVLLPPSRAPAIVSVMALSQGIDARFVEDASPAISAAAMLVCALECPADAVTQAFRVARAAGVPTVLNPSPADALPDGLLELTDVLVANEPEAALLAGRPADPAASAMRLAQRLAPARVVVTAGPGGAWFASDGSTTGHVPAPDVRVVDTTGAGDAFLGALVARLVAGASLDQAAAYGVRVASLSVTREGSIGSYPSMAELEPSMAGRA